MIAQPASSQTLCQLGNSQLAMYDNNPASDAGKRALADARLSYRASIAQEGKPSMGGELPKQLEGKGESRGKETLKMAKYFVRMDFWIGGSILMQGICGALCENELLSLLSGWEDFYTLEKSTLFSFSGIRVLRVHMPYSSQ